MNGLGVWLLASLLLTQTNVFSAKQPFEITISSTTPTVAMGSPPEITVTLKNNSGRALDTSTAWSSATRVDPNWRFDVRDAEGRAVPRRVYSRFALGFGSVVFSAVKPEQSVTDHVDLSRLYVFNKPGKFRIQVSREIPRENGGGTAKSNVITITITK